MTQAEPTILNSTTASRRCDEEEISPQCLEGQVMKQQEAWTVMPHLFDIWDVNESGGLDKNELLAGIAQFCDVAGLDFDSRRVVSIFGEVDANGDCVLDRREFSVFISRFADSIDVPLDDFAFVVAEQLVNIVMKPHPVQQHDTPPGGNQSTRKGGSNIKNTSTQVVDQRRESWAELKFTSEALHTISTLSPWERLRLGLAMHKYRAAGQNMRTSATIDLWFSMQQVLVLKERKAEAHAAKEASIVETQTDSPPRGFVASMAAIRRKGEAAMDKPSNSPVRRRSLDSQWIKECFLVRRRGSTSSDCDDQHTLLDEHQCDEDQLLSVSELENFQPNAYDTGSEVPPQHAYDMDTHIW
eukprot:CAMPEP_0119009724 /NCGR_PEP_ID=MMETSP1176-20130426/4560_1 /TAXON_ID=265551 /ORGANISM="Synedropsis recta cf, Strain CCMP1620" /LENGTH=355 /DNA_ID=CAMNT_0006962293 /DNA_START=98 /DNA_END=1165 /DNA_ORIENTATION=-